MEEFAFTPFSTPPQPGNKAYLVDADGGHYVFEVEIISIDKRNAVLNVSSVNSESIGEQKPRPLEKRDYAEVELRSEGCIHVRFGTKGELVNYSDRDGYLFFPTPKDAREHVRLMAWIYDRWIDLLPNAGYVVRDWNRTDE
ncbi:MAG: hypothetical protein ACFUZC_04670 [Chthoniobacteraceae bacterium]